MSDDLVKSLEWSCRDPVTHEPIDDGDYSNATVSEVKQAIAEITRLRAELATARREGMETMAGKIAGWHEAQATEYEAQARKFEKLKTISDFTSANPAPDGFQYAVRYAEGAAAHRQRAAAIRAAAKEGK